MSTFIDKLTAAGLQLTPLVQAGLPVSLSWDPAQTGPIFGDTVLVALSDTHFSDGGSGDVFLGMQGDAQLKRFMRLLHALVAVRAAVPSLSLVHLGDFYDVWRAYPAYDKDQPTGYDKIHARYGEAIGLLTQTLKARVCVGNHDAILGLYPPSWANAPDGPNGRLAYGHRFANGRVFGLHSHQSDALAKEMDGDGGNEIVKLMTMAAALCQSFSQSVQQGFDLFTDFFPDHLADMGSGAWPLASTPTDSQGFRATRWSERTGIPNLEKLMNKIPIAADLRLIFVGHSHLPCVSFMHIGGRLVPLVDTGCWIQGKSHVAIAEEGSVTLYNVS